MQRKRTRTHRNSADAGKFLSNRFWNINLGEWRSSNGTAGPCRGAAGRHQRGVSVAIRSLMTSAISIPAAKSNALIEMNTPMPRVGANAR